MDKEELYREIEKQKVEMSPGERVANYLQGKRVDFIPHGVLSANDAIASIHGISKGELFRSYDANCAMFRYMKEDLGVSGTRIQMGLRGIGEASGSILERPEHRVDFIAQHTCMNYDEFMNREPFDVWTNPVLAPKLKEGKRLLEDFPNEGISTDVAGPITTAAAIRPIEMILRDTRKNPEQLHWLLNYCVDSSLQWVKAFHETTGCTTVGISDPVTTTDIISYSQFLEFNKPYLKRLFEGIRNITGKNPSLHICGHTKGIWKDLAEIGVTNFSLDNCEKLAEAKQVMGDTTFISGNVPPVNVMLCGTIDDVIESVRQCIIEGADSPSGFMLMTGCQVPIGTPLENMHALQYAARKYGANAVKGQIPEAAFND